MPNIDAYRQLCNVASEVHWPERYRNDLYVIDRELLCEDRYGKAPDVFGWILRDYGTHIVDPRWHGQGAWNAEMLRKSFGGMNYREHECLFYWYAYGQLKRVSLDYFCELYSDWKSHFRCHATCEYCR